jgi:hypothetical protein
MPSSDFCLIPRGVAIQVQRSAISTPWRQAPWSARERADGRAHPMGPRRAQRGPPPMSTPKKFGGGRLPPRWSCSRKGCIRHKNRLAVHGVVKVLELFGPGTDLRDLYRTPQATGRYLS